MDNQLLNQSTTESTQSVQPQSFALDGGDHQIDPNHQDSDIRPDIRPGRQRVKRACQPCKSRKKRCDGSEPCATCIRYGYECHYELGPRKRRRHILKDHDTDVSQSHSSPDTSIHHRDEKEKAESDSGHVSQPGGVKDTNLWGKAFAASLALKLDAGKLSKPHLAWNLGLKDEQTYAQPAITRVIDQGEMERLANYYFDTTHQIFGIFKRDLVERKIVERWGVNFNNSDPHDPILCGIAALGSLFSGGNPSPAEASLVELAKMALETTSVLNYPSRHHVVAWVLRTLFLRCTACPHAAWLASCTTMHIIESVGMEDDSDTTSNDAELERGTPVGCGVLNMQRLFWIARLMNSWVANDYGRSKVTLKIPTPSFPLPEGEVDVTLDYLTLFQISERLDQDVSHTAVEFEAGIAAIYDFHARSDGAILSQTNLCLGFYRRLRLLSSSISQEAVDQVISVCTKGLGAVMRMVERRQPWWHVGNIPFQFVCVLLAMDTPEALSHIGEALETLDAVSRCFTTRSLTESAATARTLVELSQKRKLEEINILGQGLKTRIDPTTMGSSQLQIPVMNGKQMMPSSTMLGNGSGNNMMSGMSNIGSMDFTGFDWDSFLSMDIPVLDATAIL